MVILYTPIFFVVRNKHYYPGTIGSFFGGKHVVEREGSFCHMLFASSVLNRVLFCFSSLQTSSVMYITGQGVVLGDNAIGRGRGGGGCVPVAFPVLQTGGVVNIPGGDAQIASMPPQDSQDPDLLLVPLEMPAMPPQSVVQETGQPPPYHGDTQSGSQDPDLLLVPLEVTPMPPQSVVQETSQPPPYHGDTQSGSQDPDLLLVPLEVTPMPPQSVVQETGPPPPYHQISTCATGGPSSGAEGEPPPPYTEDEQVSVKYKLRYVLVYSQIRFIALRVLQTSKKFWVFLFRQSS